MAVLLSATQLDETICQLAETLNKAHPGLKDVVLVGIQQGGAVIGEEIAAELRRLNPGIEIPYGQLDITFYRDDIRKNIIPPDKMNIHFGMENKTVILIDDVLFTGRTIKAALDALIDYGRPAKVELCVLVDRKEHRQFPIQADYAGKTLETAKTDKVKLKNREVILISN